MDSTSGMDTVQPDQFEHEVVDGSDRVIHDVGRRDQEGDHPGPDGNPWRIGGTSPCELDQAQHH